MLKSIDYLVVGRRRSTKSLPDWCHRWQVSEWGFFLLFIVDYLIDYRFFFCCIFYKQCELSNGLLYKKSLEDKISGAEDNDLRVTTEKILVKIIGLCL